MGKVIRMDSLDIAEFLEGQSTGVLSLAKDADGYAIPVSFVYDEDGPHVYFRLGYAPGSQKREYVEASDTVSFVVYDETDRGWESVVARGHLEELSTNSLDSNVVEAVRHLDIPYFNVHDRPASGLEFSIVRIRITSLKGIVEN